MPIVEGRFKWSLGSGTSTGASTTVWNTFGYIRELTLILGVDAASTCSIGIEAGASETGSFARIGSTAYSLSTNEAQVVQITGPLPYIRPYIIARTDSAAVITIDAWGN